MADERGSFAGVREDPPKATSLKVAEINLSFQSFEREMRPWVWLWLWLWVWVWVWV